MSIKITTISTAPTGGAGLAAYRLHCGLLEYTDINSIFVHKHIASLDNSKLEKTHSVIINESLLYKVKCHFEITPEHENWNKIVKRPSNYEIVSFPRSSYRIEDLEIVKESDIINLHWVADFLNYPSFLKKVKQPIVWTLHDMNPFMGIFHYEEDKNRNKANLGDIDNEAYFEKLKIIHQKKNIHVVCLSEWMKEKSEKSEMFKGCKHYLIPNGLNFDGYPLLDRGSSKEKLNINNGLKTILFIAHDVNVYRKGFNLILKAIKGIKDIQFNLISVGGDKVNLDADINHIHYNRIHNPEELNVLYTAADITIIPSREDNLPNVMLESLANGTPVLSFSNGGMAEHIQTGYNGILVETIGVEPLKLQIRDFLEDKYSFDSEKIRQYASLKFSNITQAERYAELYKSILSQ